MFEFVKNFPIRVLIFKRYGNILRPVEDRARFEKVRIKTENGFIENNYLLLKKGKVKIPVPEIQFYYDIENVRWIYLLQLDRYTFYPITFQSGQMLVYFPTYEVDKKGEVVKDEKGNPKIKYVPKVLLNSSIALEDGRIINLPNMITHKTYDKEHWLSNEIETAQRLYRSKGFWERFGNYIMLGIIGIFLVMIFYVGTSRYAELTKTLTDGLKNVANAMVQVADNLRLAVQSSQAFNATITKPQPPY